MLYEELLDAYGFEVLDVAKNGEEAVKKYNAFPIKPDVIIMDHRMPIKTGIEATEEIIQYDINAKIIFTSADETVKRIALSVGALIFEAKLFHNNTLIDNITKLVGNK
ncbi:MAG: response regulator [Candidatus Lokiarchaeota archaeon]|nr:response regulator [Candidatus Lokiarchaeota archaeon]